MNLYYYSNLSAGVNLDLADYLGIPPEQRTGDYTQALAHPGPLWIIDSWNQQSKQQLILERRQRRLPTELIYDYSYESGPGQPYAEEYEQREGPVCWFVNPCVAKTYRSRSHLLIDYFALSAVYRWQQRLITPSLTLPSHRQPRVNCLISKLETRPSRLYTIYRLWQQGLADDAELGLLAHSTALRSWHKSSQPFNDPEFWAWLEVHLGARDSVDHYRSGQTYVCPGYPFDPEIYAQSRVSIVCETASREWAVPAEFITEKTYRSLINRSPCVWISLPGVLDYLESLGFDTLRQHLADPNYDRGGPEEYSHIDRAIEAAEEIMQLPQTVLDQSAEQNLQNLITRAQHSRRQARARLNLKPDPQWAENLRGN